MHASCMLWKALYLFSSQDEWLVSKLFGCLCERYAAQPQGFTWVLRIPNWKGDNAPMAIVELVDNRLVTEA